MNADIERPIAIAYVPCRTGSVTETVQATWAQLSKRLARCDVGPKDGPAWMPASIAPGLRKGERVTAVNMLVVDVEAESEAVFDEHGDALLDAHGDRVKRVVGPDPVAPDAMLAELSLWGWRAILHTSYGHTPEHPRYRLVIAIDRPLKPDEVRPLGLHVAGLLGIGDCIDVGCLEPARLFYLPRCPEARLPLFFHGEIEGVSLPVDALLADAERLAKAREIAPRRTGKTGNVIALFNAAHTVGEILERNGYVQKGRTRWLWPGSTTGLAGVRLLPDTTPERVYSSHAGDPLNDGHAHDAFDCFRILEHGGDIAAAVKAAADGLGLRREVPTLPAAPSTRLAAQATDSATDSDGWPPSLDLEALADRDPEAPAFIIGDWLPCGYATLFAGHGGIGKSAIALHLAVCIAAGLPFFGLPVERRRVTYLSCEDRERVLHWRLARICAFLSIQLDTLRGWLEVFDLVGADAILWDRDPRTGATFTPSYGRLEARIRDCDSQVVFVDGVADTFAGNENARGDVKRYVNALVGLIPADTGAVVLIGHVAKPSATAGAAGDGYSGSTGWHNSARARWYLYPESAQGDDGLEKSGDLLLELQKSNLGRTDQSMRFSWSDEAHMFVGREIAGQTAFDRAHRDRTEQAGILAALRACAAASPPITVPAATTGQRTGFQVLSMRPEFPETLRAGTPAKRRFWRHIEALRQMRDVEEASYRRANRHVIAQLVAASPENADYDKVRRCAE